MYISAQPNEGCRATLCECSAAQEIKGGPSSTSQIVSREDRQKPRPPLPSLERAPRGVFKTSALSVYAGAWYTQLRDISPFPASVLIRCVSTAGMPSTIGGKKNSKEVSLRMRKGIGIVSK